MIEHDDILEKDRAREERMRDSKKARDRRALIRSKKARQQEEGYRGNV